MILLNRYYFGKDLSLPSKSAFALFSAHSVFLKCSGLFVSADTNIAQFHRVISLPCIVDFIVQKLIKKGKKMNVDLQMMN
jgi:Tfp pilus assembly protein PilZ